MYKIGLSVLLLGSLIACKGDSESSTLQQSTTMVEELPEEVAADLEGLELNDGKKWVVDKSTDNGMKEVAELVAAFDGTDSKKLGKKIKKKLNGVIKDCDFKGEDHEQFHIVLHAMLKEAKNLKKGNSTDPGKIQSYLDAYDAYFEVGELE